MKFAFISEEKVAFPAWAPPVAARASRRQARRAAKLLDDPKDWTLRFGEVRVEEGDKVIMGYDGVASGDHTLRVRYQLTELGLDFLFVVRQPR